MRDVGLNANLDDAINQNYKFCKKKVMRLFICSRKNKLDNVAVCLANVNCISHFFINKADNGLLLIAEFIRELADIIAIVEVKNWV